MEKKRSRRDTTLAAIVIVAGLITGGLLTYMFLQPEEEEGPRYTPEYRVAESQRVPMDSAETNDPPADAVAGEDDGGPAGGAVAQDTSPEENSEETTSTADESPGDADPDATVGDDESTAADRETVQQARERMEERGITQYRELTEELYIRVSAKMVIMASVLSQEAPEDADPTEIQHLMADHVSEVLAGAQVDPEDFWAYTRDVHSDPERAKEMGEKILHEAEKHTERKITFEDVPGMTPTPVPQAQED